MIGKDLFAGRHNIAKPQPPIEEGGHQWRWTTEKPPEDWADPRFDDSSWQLGNRPASNASDVAPSKATAIWQRTELQLPLQPVGMMLHCVHDKDIEVYVNGALLLEARGLVREYQQRPLKKAEMELFREGRNVIAVRGQHTHGNRSFDLGISWVETVDEETVDEEERRRSIGLDTVAQHRPAIRTEHIGQTIARVSIPP